MILHRVEFESFYCMGTGNWSMLPVGSRSHPGLATDPVDVLTENNHTFKELLALPEGQLGLKFDQIGGNAEHDKVKEGVNCRASAGGGGFGGPPTWAHQGRHEEKTT